MILVQNKTFLDFRKISIQQVILNPRALGSFCAFGAADLGGSRLVLNFMDSPVGFFKKSAAQFE